MEKIIIKNAYHLPVDIGGLAQSTHWYHCWIKKRVSCYNWTIDTATDACDSNKPRSSSEWTAQQQQQKSSHKNRCQWAMTLFFHRCDASRLSFFFASYLRLRSHGIILIYFDRNGGGGSGSGDNWKRIWNEYCARVVFKWIEDTDRERESENKKFNKHEPQSLFHCFSLMVGKVMNACARSTHSRSGILVELGEQTMAWTAYKIVIKNICADSFCAPAISGCDRIARARQAKRMVIPLNCVVLCSA